MWAAVGGGGWGGKVDGYFSWGLHARGPSLEGRGKCMHMNTAS